MNELSLELAFVEIVAAAAAPALAGVEILAARASEDAPANLVAMQCVRAQPLVSSTTEVCDLEVSVRTHSGDAPQAAHAARWDATMAALRAFTFPGATRAGVVFLGRPHFGEAVHGQDENATWVSLQPVRVMVRPAL